MNENIHDIHTQDLIVDKLNTQIVIRRHIYIYINKKKC